ncbi:MAG: hypothetical protein U0175_14740 [Caldilineaceae bacterium]
MILAQIAPQRGAQYSALASTLAPYELQLSPLGKVIRALESVDLAGQSYLKLTLERAIEEAEIAALGSLAMCSAFFDYYDVIGDQVGPFLRPLTTQRPRGLPADLVMTRRYKGKTNEMFTHFLCNVARSSSNFADQDWRTLRLLDPIAGGGTTLFTALMLGASALGVEQSEQDSASTASFLEQYCREERIRCQSKEERMKKLGKRWQLTVGDPAQSCVIAAGDTVEADKLLLGLPRPHLIVGDLPYGIQHVANLTSLLKKALPVWTSLLLPGGTLTLAWETRPLPRSAMLELLSTEPRLRVLNNPPYTQLAHRVDRVIKERDVVVVRREM